MRYLLTLPQRFVKVGCLAVASELFGLQGVALQFTETAGRVSELVSRVPQAQTMDDWMAHPSGPESTAAIFTRRGLQAFAGEAALPGCTL